MSFKLRSHSPIKKKSRRGFRGYPAATVAYYGPNDVTASKVAVGIMTRGDAPPDFMNRWFIEDGDARTDARITREILEFIQSHGVKSVVMTDGIIGCPHEEGIDYPDDAVCPKCPFWANRDRWTGDIVP